jgi:AraC-like DNA-binding protein
MSETIYIKNMVCNRCIMVVQGEFGKLGYSISHVALGAVTVDQHLSDDDKVRIEHALIPLGFALIDDKKSRLILQIKTLIIELVRNQNGELKTNLSQYLSDRLHYDYNHLSGLFSDVEGTTIEKFFIAQKIERVKELLVYDELSLSEIAFQLNYSSVAHLSSQFKKVTGLTPSHFRNIGLARRKPLDQI